MRHPADVALGFINAERPDRFAGLPRPIEAVVFDMDGTLAEVSAIARQYLHGPKRDFNGFHTASEHAEANAHVVEATLTTYAAGQAVLIATARMTDFAALTARWLDRVGVRFDRMYMRRHDDFRPDREVKAEMLAQMRADGFEVVHAWDDNPHILAMWAEHGIPTTEVDSHMRHPEGPLET